MSVPASAARRGSNPFVGTDFASSAAVWLALVAFLVVVRVFIVTIGAGLENDPRASLFDFPLIAIFGAAGLAGIWFSHLTGFPAALDPRITNRQRLLYPAVIGLIFGVLLVGQELLTNTIQLFLDRSGVPFFNAPFPGSLLLYPGGAIIVDVLYRFLPIPLLLWLVSSVLLGGRAQEATFWVLAALTSLLEPLSQELGLLDQGLAGTFAIHFATGFAMNLSEATMFRRYGILACLVVRWAAYLIWHIVYGNFICAC